MKINLKKVRDLRMSKKMTFHNMAEIIGFDTKSNKNIASMYQRKENGTIKFTLLEAKKLADFFEMPIEDLFFDGKYKKK